MDVLIKFLKEYVADDGEVFAVGDQARVTKSFADELVKSGYAKAGDEPQAADAARPAGSAAGGDPGGDPAAKAAADRTDPKEPNDSARLSVLEAQLAEQRAIIAKMARTPAAPGRLHVRVTKAAWEEDGKCGYDSFGVFLKHFVARRRNELGAKATAHFDAVQAYIRDQHLNAPEVKTFQGQITTKAAGNDEMWSGEASYGGVLIPLDFRKEILELDVPTPVARANGAMTVPINGAAAVFPVLRDFTRSAGAIAGVQAYRDHERATIAVTRAETFDFTLTPKRISVGAHVTGYALGLNPAIGDLIMRQMAKALSLKESYEHIQGQGGGEGRGVLYQPSLLTATRTVAGDISADDIVNMFVKIYDYENCVWLVGRTGWAKLFLMAKVIGAGGSLVLNNSLADKFQMNILGRPLILNEFMPALGSQGDLTLVNFNQLMIGDSAYRRSDRTIFVRYMEDEDTFRLIVYTTCDSHWPTFLTLRDASQVSPFVALSA